MSQYNKIYNHQKKSSIMPSNQQRPSLDLQFQDSIGDQSQRITKYEDHPFRQLRRCPHCGTIRLKIAGCNQDMIILKYDNFIQFDQILIGQMIYIQLIDEIDINERQKNNFHKIDIKRFICFLKQENR
ncbi:hypothetical protein pb186bvf_016452 [Paramecium bursaria]